jgi:hypothetical protein
MGLFCIDIPSTTGAQAVLFLIVSRADGEAIFGGEHAGFSDSQTAGFSYRN